MVKGKPSKGLRKARASAGVSIERFAKAKRSTYDKRAAADQASRLRAQRLSKFKRLKAKMTKEGRLLPPQVRRAGSLCSWTRLWPCAKQCLTHLRLLQELDQALSQRFVSLGSYSQQFTSPCKLPDVRSIRGTW